jgi:hypothetical protein
MTKNATWATELLFHAVEVTCMLEALGKVDWSISEEDGDEDDRSQLIQGVRGVKRSIQACLIDEFLEPPSYKSAQELEAFEVASWKQEAMMACYESQALVAALATAARKVLHEEDGAILGYALEGVGRQLGAIADTIDRAPRGATPKRDATPLATTVPAVPAAARRRRRRA